MKVIVLADNVSATAVANQTAVQLLATPFLAGRDVVATIDPNAVTGTPNFRIQGSDDNTTWVDLATSTSLGEKVFNIKCRPYMRFGVFTVGGAGIVTAHISNGA